MGGWNFVKPRFENMCGRKVVTPTLLTKTFFFLKAKCFPTASHLQIKYCGRAEGGTTAVGVSQWHKAEAASVVQTPFTIVP